MFNERLITVILELLPNRRVFSYLIAIPTEEVKSSEFLSSSCFNTLPIRPRLFSGFVLIAHDLILIAKYEVEDSASLLKNGLVGY